MLTGHNQLAALFQINNFYKANSNLTFLHKTVNAEQVTLNAFFPVRLAWQTFELLPTCLKKQVNQLYAVGGAFLPPLIFLK